MITKRRFLRLAAFGAAASALAACGLAQAPIRAGSTLSWRSRS
jgi:hypothetical protein